MGTGNPIRWLIALVFLSYSDLYEEKSSNANNVQKSALHLAKAKCATNNCTLLQTGFAKHKP